MSSIATSVVSAAVIGGDLVLGLSDGSIINCGRVQGPQGLKGDQGPIGATGQSGTDGNTIHTVAGAPDTTLGRDGDFAINTVVWEIYGPRAGGAWGTGTPLRGNKRGGGVDRRELFGNNSTSEGGGGVNQTSATLPLSNPTRLSGARGLPDTSGLKSQSDYNQWAYDSLESLAAGVSPDVDLSGYATEEYVDQADNALSGRIQAVEQDYTTSDEFSTVTQQVNKNKTDIKALQEAPAPEAPNLDSYATKQDLATATGALPYRLETDKVLRSADLPEKQNAFDEHVGEVHAGGEIQLVDNLGYFHNVRFTGEHGIETRSDQQGIIVDGSGLQSRIATLEQQVATLIELVPPVDYGTVTITGGNEYANGQCWLPPDELGVFTCELSGSQTHGVRYKWEIMRGAARISGSDSLSVLTVTCTDPAPNNVVLRCTVTHPTTNDAAHGEVQILVQNLD